MMIRTRNEVRGARRGFSLPGVDADRVVYLANPLRSSTGRFAAYTPVSSLSKGLGLCRCQVSWPGGAG